MPQISPGVRKDPRCDEDLSDQVGGKVPLDQARCRGGGGIDHWSDLPQQPPGRRELEGPTLPDLPTIGQQGGQPSELLSSVVRARLVPWRSEAGTMARRGWYHGEARLVPWRGKAGTMARRGWYHGEARLVPWQGEAGTLVLQLS